MKTNSVWDWTLTGGVVGGLIGSAWGATYVRFQPECAVLFLLYITLGLVAGLTGGCAMGVSVVEIENPPRRFLRSVLVGTVASFMIGIPLFIVGALFTTPSGLLGAVLTNMLLPHLKLRWASAALLVLVLAVVLVQWARYVPSVD